MKAHCRAAELKTALNHITPVTTKRASLSILAHIKMEVVDSGIVLQGTDLSVGIQVEVPATNTEPGVCAYDGQLLARVLESASPRAMVTLEHAEGTLTISLPHGVTSIRTVSHDEFPALPTTQETQTSITADQQQLVSGLKSVMYAASPSEVKPEISAVYVYKQDESLVMVSTDSFRLAEKKIPVMSMKTTEQEGILIPVKSCVHIVRVFDNPEDNTVCELVADDTKITINQGVTTLTSRLVNGRYPAYQAIIPQTAGTTALLLQNDLVQALKSTSLFTDRFSQIDLTISSEEQTITFAAQNPDVGETVYTTKAQVTGESMEIRCNAKFVKDSLQSIKTDSVQLEFTDPKRPFLLKPVGEESFQYLVMPLNRT